MAVGSGDALLAVGEVDGVAAKGEAFDFRVLADHVLDFRAAHVGGDADVANKAFFLGA